MAYDCSKCPGFCCSYPATDVDDADIKRLAKHFDLPFRVAKKRFTKIVQTDTGPTRSLRQHADPKVFGEICMFFDVKKRRCTVYEARPSVCRDFPYGKTCGYYNFLAFERKHQGDNKLKIVAYITS